jgi:hypothetical protein
MFAETACRLMKEIMSTARVKTFGGNCLYLFCLLPRSVSATLGVPPWVPPPLVS